MPLFSFHWGSLAGLLWWNIYWTVQQNHQFIVILIRILQKIFHLIGSLSLGTNQSCIKRNCLKDVNIVKRHILNPKMKIIKILQKRESTTRDVSNFKMQNGHITWHCPYSCTFKNKNKSLYNWQSMIFLFNILIYCLNTHQRLRNQLQLHPYKKKARSRMSELWIVLSLFFFFYYVHALMVCTFPVLERLQISFSITKIFLCGRNPV